MSVIDSPSTDFSRPIESHDPVAAPRPASTPRKRKKKSWWQSLIRQLTMLTRRIHLYTGLFMFPWVLMYGFTGWFFNHPSYFTGDQVQRIAPTTLVDGKLAAFPSPDQLAAQVVREINLDSFLVDGPQVTLTGSVTPQFDRYINLNAQSEHQSHRIEIHPVTGHGEVRTTFRDASAETEETTEPIAPLAEVTRVAIKENPLTIARASVPDLLREMNLEPGTADVGRFGPKLIFSADVDGQPCLIRYDLQSGDLMAESPQATTATMDPKRFSQRLHMARGYTPNWGTRTLWAVSVDAMFFSMVFWGCSGIVMWWQIKRTRKLGAVVLLASLVCATWLVVGMHEELSSQSRGRGHGGRGRQVATRNQPVVSNTSTADSQQQPSSRSATGKSGHE